MKISHLIFFVLTLLSSGAVAQDIRVCKLSISANASDEMAPFIKDSVLYFSSNKQVSLLKRYFDGNKQPLYHIFSATLNADSSFSKPKQFLSDYMSPFHTGSIIFSSDGNKMFIGQNHYDSYKRSRNSRSGNPMGIYQAEKNDRGWSRKNNLSFNSRRDYNTAQPALSDDGRLLFFVSDMEGGYGKTDIYYSEKINDEWEPAVNLGPQINTEGSELFPFYHRNGKLYFASDRSGGQGGLDIYYSLKTVEGWTKPKALESGINTEANEFSCYISDDEQWGLFASDKEGKDNLYRFDRIRPVFDACRLQKEESFCYEFFDDATLDEDTKGPYSYKWTFDGTKTAMGDTVLHCFPGPGEYNVKLSLVDNSVGAEVFALSEYTLQVERAEGLYIAGSDTVKIDQLTTFDVTQSNLGDFMPGEYYWELSDGTFAKGETISHVFRKTGKYRVKCGAVSSRHPQLKWCIIKEIIVID